MSATEQIAPLSGNSIIGTRQRWWFVPALVLSWFGTNVVSGAILGASLPKLFTLQNPDQKEAWLAIVTGIGGVAIVVATPLFGRFSDRTRSRWGMRKPWMAGGLIVGFIGTVILAFTYQLPLLVVGYCIVQLGFGSVAMAQHTLLADQVPARIRARVSAAVGVAGSVAIVVSAALVAALPLDKSWTWFVVPGLVGVVTGAPLLFLYRDARRAEPVEPIGLRGILDTYYLSPRRYHDFAWAWASRFFMTLSILTVSLFLFFLIVDLLNFTAEQAGGVQTTALVFFLLGSIVSTAIFGWLSDKLQRRKVIIWISGFITAIGLVTMILFSDVTGFTVGITIVGIAQGAYIAVDVALMTEVLPSASDAGKDLGIVALAYQVPQVLAPILGASIVGLTGSYPVLLMCSIGFAVLGGITIIPIRGVR